MKHITAFSFLLAFLCSACNSPSIERTTTCAPSQGMSIGEEYLCTSDLCNQYTAIWEAFFQEKNNVSQAFFDAHIFPHRSDINTWEGTVVLRMNYEIKIGWATAYTYDQLIIQIDGSNPDYPDLDLPRDVYLTKEQIELAIENDAFYTRMTPVTNVDELAFPSLEEALEDLITFAGVNTLCFLEFDLDNDNGHLILKAKAEYENEENSCILGTMDVITGEKESRDGRCFL